MTRVALVGVGGYTGQELPGSCSVTRASNSQASLVHPTPRASH